MRQSAGRSPIATAPRSRQTSPIPIRLLAASLAAAWLLIAPAVNGAGKTVVLLTATGIVDSVMAGYVGDGIARAERDGAAAVVIEIDTPGGSLDAMSQIYKAELNATVPVITWVAPSGARAASAGTFITLAGNLAYMAPATNIGAASPVDSSGNDITGTEGQKVKNDAIAAISSIAERRGRNVDWAKSTVESAVSSPASEAVRVGAVNGIAASIDDVLAAASGQQVTLGDGSVVTLDLQGATVAASNLNVFQGFLHLLSDPNIAFILFTVGFYGLIFEVIHPNFATGTIGALSIILALIGFGSLPLNVGGLLLLVLGLALIVLELHVVSHGVLTVAGVACFVLGASALYSVPASPSEGDFSVALPLIATMAITSVLFLAVALGTVLGYRRRLALRPVPYGAGSGPSLPSGTTGEVRSPLHPGGTVYAAGQEWSARTAEEAPPGGAAVPRGTPVTVVGQEGLTLIVRPDGSAGPAA
ncbi:MAG TPA: nodulation protein NfeD [Candidatus Limnocylindrales bacterium]|nr:nodulation protein NfeD [Candidatus Limnocylindrales bacterium]